MIGFGFTFGFAGATTTFFFGATFVFGVTFFTGVFATTFFAAFGIGFFETFLVEGVAFLATFLTVFGFICFLVGIKMYVRSMIAKNCLFVNHSSIRT